MHRFIPTCFALLIPKVTQSVCVCLCIYDSILNRLIIDCLNRFEQHQQFTPYSTELMLFIYSSVPVSIPVLSVTHGARESKHRLWSNIEARLSSLELRATFHHGCNAQRDTATIYDQLRFRRVARPNKQRQRAGGSKTENCHQASQLQHVILQSKQYSNR